MPRGKAVLAFLFTWISAASLAAQPYINYRGVSNAASLAPQGLPGGGIARGSVFTIVGRNLGPAAPEVNASPLDNELAGVSVQVIQGGVTLAAIPTSVSASRVSAIMPSNAPLGKAALRVRFNNRSSNPAWINVVESAFGIYTINGLGFGPGVIRNYVPEADNTTAVTARPGQTLTLKGTGLGDELAAPVEIFVGGKLAVASQFGKAAGVDEIAFDVPADAPQGCYVPVQVRTRGATMSNAATLAIDPEGNACSDPFNPVGEAMRKGGRFGIVAPQRFDVLVDLQGQTEQVVIDQIDVALHQGEGGDLWFNPATSLPPVGACTFYGGAAATNFSDLLRLLAPQGRFLDGGAGVQLSGAGAPLTVGPREPGTLIYSAQLGRQPGLPGSRPLFFNFPGVFNFLIPGGADVQTARAQFETTEPVRWTNREQLAVLDRAAGLPLNWTGGDPQNDVVLIVLLSNNDAANSTGLGLCVAPPGDGSFVVPPEILASLPATASNAVRIPAWVFVGSTRARNPVRFSAPGLDAGFIVPSQAGGISVIVP